MAEDDSHTDTVSTAEPPAEPDAAVATAAARGTRLPWLIAGISALVAIIAVVTALVLVADARGDAGRAAEVEQAAGEFALTLTNWDASDGMGDTREALRAAGTEAFAADVDDLFGGTDDLATLAELGARSSGEVRDLLVQRVDGDEAVALAVIVQRVTTSVTEGEEVSLRYAELTLVPDGGEWRVERVELVVDALQESATRTDATELPGFGDSGDEPASDAGEEASP